MVKEVAFLQSQGKYWRDNANYWDVHANTYAARHEPNRLIEAWRNNAKSCVETAEMYERIEAVVSAAYEWVATHGNPRFEEKLLVAVAALNKEE